MTTQSTTTSTTLTLTQPGARDWRSRAACLDVDPELFFPVAIDGPAHDIQVDAAKAVCAHCPVTAECLAEALARIPYGICGGLTEVERRALARRPERAGTAEAGGQAA